MANRKGGKPPFAEWLVEQREARGWKAEDLAKRLRDLGYAAEDSTYRTWESRSDRRPAPDTIEALERLFGARAPADAEAWSGDLAAAIKALADELREWRTEDRVRLAAVERFVKGAGAARRAIPIAPGAGGSRAPRARPRTGG